MSRAYYNEIDPYAAQWLRNLIDAGHIAPGDVDERSIEDVNPDDLKGYEQCHFFAGVGVWSLALRRAGWSDDRPVWTGSCPCQPFSAAGKGAGVSDERHLWPAFYHLITQCEPGRVFGEQVASKDGLGWLDLVQTDLEGANYSSGAIDLCAAGVGAPHIRQRLWFVAERLADLPGAGRGELRRGGLHRSGQAWPHFDDVEQVGGLAHTDEPTRKLGDSGRSRKGTQPGPLRGLPLSDGTGTPCGLADSGLPEPPRRDGDAENGSRGSGAGVHSGDVPAPHRAAIEQHRQPGPTNGLWGAADWLFCRDGKWRPVEPGTFPLAHGAASRVGRLRAFGNAINVEAAETFVRAYLDGDGVASASGDRCA